MRAPAIVSHFKAAGAVPGKCKLRNILVCVEVEVEGEVLPFACFLCGAAQASFLHFMWLAEAV